MEKLKCTSCNGDLEVEDNGKYATCKFCGTKYKLEGNKTVVINVGDFDKLKSMVDTSAPKAIVRTSKVMIVLIMVITVVMIAVFARAYITNTNNNKKELDIKSFNQNLDDYYQYKIYDDGAYVAINGVEGSNERNPDHRISVVYKEKTYSTDEEIEEVKKLVREACRKGKLKYHFYISEGDYINQLIIE